MDFIDEYYANKDLSLLKKLTIIIPTYNRNYYLSRCLWYHSHFPFGEIIVADSSQEEKKVVNRETVRKLVEEHGTNIRYLEYPPETEKYGGDIYRKWGDAVQHVETEYSQICTDKEFLIPMTLCVGIDFLMNHSDYKIITGKFSSLKSNSKDNAIFVRKYSKRKPFVSEDSVSRFINALHAGWDSGLGLSLYATPTQKEIYSSYLNSPPYDIRFGERCTAFIGYLYGKVEYLEGYEHNVRDIIYVQTANGINKSESSTLRYLQMHEYDKKSEEYKFIYSACKNYIINQMTLRNTNVDRDINLIFLEQIELILTRDALDYSNLKYRVFRPFNYLIQICSNLVHEKNKLPINDEMQIILDIVLRTKNCHQFDEVIKLDF